MAIDATFERIESVKAHPNADRLELVMVSGYQVVAGKGEFKVGDPVFYIRDDAKLIEFDNVKLHATKIEQLTQRLAKMTETDHDYDKIRAELEENATYKFKYPWQEPLIKYLGSGGRVKTIRLRGEYSSGIAISVDKVFSHISRADARDWEADNVKLTSEFPGAFLSGKYGIVHWEAPIGNVGDLSSKGGLPYGIPKTDEENYQNLKECDIPYGQTVLLTKKLDGTSTTIIAFPDGRFHVCTRSNDLLTTADNVWNRAAKPVVPLALAWAKAKNRPLVLRGETCAPTMQKFSFNKDKDVPVPTFNLYGVMMLDETDYAKKNGLYGTPYHFLTIAKEIKEITGQDIKTVPIIGEAVLTKELLQEYRDKPLEFGEGIVINAATTHFKCKSLAYLEALSKK